MPTGSTPMRMPPARFCRASRLSSITPSYFTRIVRLSFLAPNITAAILDGRQPIELSALKLSLASLPKEWSEQRRELGFG